MTGYKVESSNARQRLLELAQKRGISLSKLSLMLGKNPSYIQQFIRKGSPRKLDENDRQMLSKYFGVADAELGGVKEISCDLEVKSAASPSYEVPRIRLGWTLGENRSCGDREGAEARLHFEKAWVERQGLAPDQVMSATIDGDSMAPTLQDGDDILIDCRMTTVRDGVHVIRLGESVMVKRLAAGHPDALLLISDNSAYPPVEVARDAVEVVGKVVWKGGRL